MKSKIIIFSFFFLLNTIFLYTNEINKVSISYLLNIIKSDKIILEKAIESKMYFSINSKDIIKVYNDIDNIELFFNELKNKIFDNQILSQISEVIDLAKKIKINASKLNDIIKSKSKNRIYLELVLLESNIYEMEIYLQGLSLKLDEKYYI